MMGRTPRDILAALTGVLVTLGVLIAVTVTTHKDSGEFLIPSLSGAEVDPGDGSDLTVTTTRAVTTSVAPNPTSAGLSGTSIEPNVTTIVDLASDEPELWEDAAACADRPRTAEIRATVAGPHDLEGAVLGWAVDGPDLEMTWVEMPEVDAGVFAVAIGPFPPESVAEGSAERILLAVEVGDVTGAGDYDDSSLFVQLWDCEAGT